MNLTLEIWRQKSNSEKGALETYPISEVSEDMSFLEMLDVLNEELIEKGIDPVAFDHDCREGICGTCGVVIDGRAHGPIKGVTTCQLHMRSFNDGDTIVVENCIRHVGYLEEIINELIGETVELNKRLG